MYLRLKTSSNRHVTLQKRSWESSEVKRWWFLSASELWHDRCACTREETCTITGSLEGAGWLALACSSATCSHMTTPVLQGKKVNQEGTSVKTRGLRSWQFNNKGSFVFICAKQNKEFIHTSRRQAGPGKQGSITRKWCVVTWEDKCRQSNHPPFLFLPSAFITENDAIWSKISLQSVGSAVPAVSSSNLLCTLSLLTGGQG